MPNVKIYMDEALLPGGRDAVAATLIPLRSLLCATLEVGIPACQFAVLPVLGMPDLPLVNVEIHILAHPNRTRERLTTLAQAVQTMLSDATGAKTAVRISLLVPENYVTLK